MTDLYKNSATIHERIAICVKLFGDGKNTIFADKIGVSEGNIRGYIKGVIPKADVLEKIVTSVDISAEWLLTGRGEIRNSDFSRNNTKESTPMATPSSPKLPEQQDQSPIIAQLLDTIKEQAEEIGRLKAHISNLENHKAHNAGDAPISETANVG